MKLPLKSMFEIAFVEVVDLAICRFQKQEVSHES